MKCDVNSNTVKNGIVVKAKELIDSGLSIAQVNDRFGEELVIQKETDLQISPSDKLVNIYLSTLTPDDDIAFQLKSFTSAADKALDKRLIEFLKPLGVTVEMLDTLKERTGVDAVGAADIINKIILVNKNKAALDTLPEETAHFFVELLGNQNSTVKTLMSKIKDWSGYQKVYDEYNTIYNGNENKIKKEAIGKLIGQYIVNNRTVSPTILEEIKKFIIEALARFDIHLVNIEDIAEDIAADILSKDYSKLRQKLPTGSRLVTYAETMDSNPKVKKISDKMRSLGFYLTGSMALRKQGTVYRPSDEKIHDLDFKVPVNLRDNWRQVIEDNFGKIETERSFSRAGENVYSVTIDGVDIDLFIKKDETPQADSENIAKWQDVLAAKLGLDEGLFGTFGRTKDVTDFLIFTPNNKTEGFDNPNYVFYSLDENTDDVEEENKKRENRKAPLSKLLNPQQLQRFKQLQNVGLISKTAWHFQRNGKDYMAYSIPKVPEYITSSSVYDKRHITYTKDYAKKARLDSIIKNQNIDFLRTVETENAILIAFGNFKNESSPYKSQESLTKSTRAGILTKHRVLNFLSKIGFTNIQSVKSLIHNGKEVEGIAYVDFINKVMQIVEGNENVTLPEEAMHILVELVQKSDPALFRSMEKDVINYKLYRQLLNDEKYLSDPEYKIGRSMSNALDYDKFKKEAMAKLLAEYMIGNTEQNIENRDRVEKINGWWRDLISWIKGIFTKYKNPFKEALAKIEEDDTAFGVFEDIKSNDIFFSKASIRKTVQERDKEYAYTKDTFLNIRDKTAKEGFTKVEDIYYKNGEKWEGKRVSDLVSSFYGQLFRNTHFTDEEIEKNNALAQDGKYIHAVFEDVFKSLVDGETGLLRVTPANLTESLYQDGLENYIGERVLKYMTEYLGQYPEGTRFLSETILFDNTKDIIGTIDFIAITPDVENSAVDKVDILDWKTKKTLEEVKDYKKEGWNIQLNTYKAMLANSYGIETFGKIRALPIERVYTKAGNLKNILMGEVDASQEEEKRLRPIISKEESTGNETKDNLIKSLGGIYKEFVQQLKDRKIPNRQILNNIENAIYELRVSNSVQNLTTYMLLLRTKVQELKRSADNEKSKDPNVIQSYLAEINLYRKIYKGLGEISELIITGEDVPRAERSALRDVNDDISLLMKLLDRSSEKLLVTIAEQNGVYNLLTPEKVVKGISYSLRAMGSHDVASIQLMHELSRKSYNRIDFETDIELKALKELKFKFDNYIKSTNISVKDATGKLIDFEKGTLHSKINKKFYETRDEVFATRNPQKILAFVKTNYDIDKWKEWYKNELESQIKLWDSAASNVDPKVDIKIKENMKKQFEQDYDIMKHPATAFNGFNKMVWSKNIKEELHLSDVYKEIQKNDTLLEIYEYFVKKNKELYDIGVLDEWQIYTFLPNIRKGVADIFSLDDKNIFQKTGNVVGQAYSNLKNKISVSDYQLNFLGQIDETTGEKIGRRFVPYVEELDKNWELYREAGINLKIITKDDKGKVASDKIKEWRKNTTNNERYINEVMSLREKSFDLFSVYGMMVKEIAKEKNLQENDEILRALKHLEENKKNFATNKFGKLSVIGGQAQISDKVGQNAELFTKYLKYLVEGESIQIDSDYSIKFSLKKAWNKSPLSKITKFEINEDDEKGISVTKFVMWLNNFNTLKTLALSASSALSNLFGNTFGADKLYSSKISTDDLMKAWTQLTSVAFYQSEDMKKRAALLDYFLPLLNNREAFKASQLSVNDATKILSQDWLMWTQRKGDEVVQANIFLAHIENTGLIDGRLVNLREKATEETKIADYYKKSPAERKEMDAAFEKRLTELKAQYSVVKLSIFKTIKEAGKDKVIIEIPGVDRFSKDVEDLRTSVQTMAKDATGSTDEFDMATFRFSILGRLAGTFKNWIPRMGDVRWAEFHYSKSHNSYEYGRFRMWYRNLSANWLASLAKIIPLPYITGKVTKEWGKEDTITRALEIYAEKRKEAQLLGKDIEAVMSEKEFIDRYIRGTEASFAELRIFTLLIMFLIFGIMAPDDDDDSEQKSVKRLIRKQIDKMSDEVGFFFNAKSVVDIAATPFPVTGFVKDLYSLFSNVSRQAFGFVLEEAGSEDAGLRMQENAKPMKYMFKVMPVLKEIIKYMPTFDAEMAKDWGIQVTDKQGF